MEKLVGKHQAAEKRYADGQDKSRAFSWYFDDDGMLVFRGRLRPEDGAVFIKAMQAMMDKLNADTFPRERDAKEETENVSAETFLQEEPATYPQKRADALLHLAEHTLAGGGEGQPALNGGDKYQVMVHVRADRDTGLQESHLEDGPVLSPAVVKPDTWMRIISTTGAGAVRPAWTTWY